MKDGIIGTTPDAIARAAGFLREGRLVAFPTETVYGLGGDATNPRAVARIFALKERPRFNPLIVHVADRAAAEEIAVFDARAREAARNFWPGPLSLVLPRRAGCAVALLASAGLDTVAVRVPANRVARALLEAAGRPVAAPSANRSGRISPTLAAHVAAEFAPDPPLIIDGGACAVGLESSVLDLTGAVPMLLRPGGVTLEALAALFGPVATPSHGAAGEGIAAPRAPGMLASHYAPALPVRLDALSARPGEALLAFGPTAPEGFAEILWLSPEGDLAAAAGNLFAMLRRLDRPEFAAIAVTPIPEEGLGRAINDRLRRAAAPR
jgi:L-threonylcarbamoyladenylate synthase